MSEVVVAAAAIRSAVETALVAHGAAASDAAVQAEALLEADLRGHHSHGLRRLPVLVGRLDAGLIVSGTAEHKWISDSVLAVDGNRGFGPVVARGAVDAILLKAERTGIALATVRNSNHSGMLAPYVERAVAAGCIGLALTTSEALVHPWGGMTAMVGTNPIGIGVPTAREPLILDMSTGSVSMGRIIDYAARGAALPPGWAIDSAGVPTTDAAAAADGAISPFGGAKGYALGIGFEALVGVLTSSALGDDVHGTLDTEHPPTKGDVFVVVSVERLGLGENLGRVADYFDLVRASAPDGHVVAIPGDRARMLRRKRIESGIPLDATLWDTVLGLGRRDA